MTAELKGCFCPSRREGGPDSPDEGRNLDGSLYVFSIITVLNCFSQHVQFMFQFQILLKKKAQGLIIKIVPVFKKVKDLLKTMALSDIFLKFWKHF